MKAGSHTSHGRDSRRFLGIRAKQSCFRITQLTKKYQEEERIRSNLPASLSGESALKDRRCQTANGKACESGVDPTDEYRSKWNSLEMKSVTICSYQVISQCTQFLFFPWIDTEKHQILSVIHKQRGIILLPPGNAGL
jgi:hypothetical protein